MSERETDYNPDFDYDFEMKHFPVFDEEATRAAGDGWKHFRPGPGYYELRVDWQDGADKATLDAIFEALREAYKEIQDLVD